MLIQIQKIRTNVLGWFRRLDTHVIPPKCGCKERCFIQGRHWGHFEGVMCHYLYDNGKDSLCGVTDEIIRPYSTQRELDKLNSEAV